MLRSKLACLALATMACDLDRPWPGPEPGLERMVHQERGEPFSKAMRVPPAGAVPYGPRRETDQRARIDAASMARGREHFRVICATCHGERGDGVSPVAARMEYRKPPSLHEPRLRALPDDEVFRVVSEGYGVMPAYANVLTPSERWTVVAYLRALQLSRAARLDELPELIRVEALEALP